MPDVLNLLENNYEKWQEEQNSWTTNRDDEMRNMTLALGELSATFRKERQRCPSAEHTISNITPSLTVGKDEPFGRLSLENSFGSLVLCRSPVRTAEKC